MEKLTEQEFNLIQEALDALSQKEIFGDFMSDLLISMICKTPEERAKIESEMAEKKWQKEAEKQLFKERITLLKAKLILLKDQIVIEQLLSQN